jgi:uncharacterized protein
MNAFFFGTGSRRLFGIYAPAQPTEPARPVRAVLLCYPWGPEYQYAHRSMRHLAKLLSAAGMHALRFDYYGTGDSAGEASEAGLTDWIGDIETAIEELQDTTGETRVSLVGLRLGAMLAAQVAAQRPQQIERLVLWDPIIDGRAYLHEIAPDPVQPSTAVATHGQREVAGFALTERLTQELQTANLAASLADFTAQVLVLVSKAAALDRHSCSLPAVEEIDSPPVWHPERGLGVGAIPVALVSRIVEWLQR